MEKNQKLYDVVYLRSFAITMLVLYHCFCIYTGKWNQYYELNHLIPTRQEYIYQLFFNRILLFTMPLFIFISGYLFSHLLSKGKYANMKDFIKNKFKRLIIPCVFFTVAISISYGDFSFDKLVKGVYHLWFLWMLFWCFIITILINKSKYRFSIAIGLAFLSIGVYPFFHIEIMSISETIRYLHLFLFGYMLYFKKEIVDKVVTNKYIFILLLGVVILLLGRNMLRLYVVTSIVFLYSFTTILLKKGILKENRYCEKLNRYSYGIYIFHHWILLFPFFYNEVSVFRILINVMELHYVFYPLLSFVFVFLSSLSLSALTLKSKIGRYLIS